MQSPALIEKIKKLNLKLKDCQDFQEIIDVGSDILGNPMLLYDVAYIAWVYTKNVVTDDPLWNEFTTTGTFSPETVAFIQTQFVDAYVKSSVTTLMKSTLKYDRLNCGIFDKNGVQIANIVMLELYHPFGSDDYELIKALCEFIAKKIENSGIVKQSRLYGETLIGSLLEGKAIEKDLYKNEEEELYAWLKKVNYVAVVDIMNFDSTLTHIVYFCEYFKKIRGDFKYFVYLNNIIIIMSFPELVLNIEKELSAFNVFFKRFNICAGVSGYFNDITQIKKYFKQALNALNYGTIISDRDNIYSYDIFRIELFLNPRLDGVDISELCHPLVFQVTQHDKNYKTSYIKFIYSYLLHSFDIELAAQSLAVNAADLKVAIKNAGKLFDIDWKNGNLMLSIMRSIRLLKCFPERLGYIAGDLKN